MLWCFFLRACLFILVARIVEKVPLVGSKKYLLDTHCDDFFAVLRRETKKNIYLTFSKNQNQNSPPPPPKTPPPPFFFVSVENTTTNTPKRVVDTTHDTERERERERERELFLLG